MRRTHQADRCGRRLAASSTMRRAQTHRRRERTRSIRCSRLLIADSTAGCWRLASANACACSRSRSATERSTLARQRIEVEHGVELRPVAGAVEPTVEAHTSQMQCLRLLTDTAISVRSLPTADELVLVFNHERTSAPPLQPALPFGCVPSRTLSHRARSSRPSEDAARPGPFADAHGQSDGNAWTVIDCATPACSSSLQLSSARPTKCQQRSRYFDSVGPALRASRRADLVETSPLA